MSWRIEAREVAEFCDHRDRDEPLHAAQRLEPLDDRREAPAWQRVVQFGLEAGDPLDLLINGAQRLLEDDLLRGVGQTTLAR